VFGFVRSEKIKKEFEELVLETIDALYNLAIQLTRNRQDAEDLVQETTLRAYRYFHRFERGTNFKAWIMTILRNLYINKYRKKLKLTQEGLARKVDISYSTIIKLETGVISDPRMETLKKLAKALDISIDELAG